MLLVTPGEGRSVQILPREQTPVGAPSFATRRSRDIAPGVSSRLIEWAAATGYAQALKIQWEPGNTQGHVAPSK